MKPYTVMVRNFISLLSPMNSLSDRILKAKKELAYVTNQVLLIDIYRIFLVTQTKYFFLCTMQHKQNISFSVSHGNFSKTDGQHFQSWIKSQRYKKTLGITPYVSWHYYVLDLDFKNNTKYYRMFTNTRQLDTSQLNHHCVKEEIKM